MIFLTSDLHLNHDNIRKYCLRPFETIQEHDETLCRNWNETVSPEDTVYILGDVGFGNRNYLRSRIESLNGSKILIIGNHDYKNVLKAKLHDCFDEIKEADRIVYGDVTCYLSHYPFLCWPGNYRFEPQFHGHVHLKKNYTGSDLKLLRDYGSVMQYDVGVDLNDYRPISIEAAIEKVRKQKSENKNCYNMWCI